MENCTRHRWMDSFIVSVSLTDILDNERIKFAQTTDTYTKYLHNQYIQLTANDNVNQFLPDSRTIFITKTNLNYYLLPFCGLKLKHPLFGNTVKCKFGY